MLTRVPTTKHSNGDIFVIGCCIDFQSCLLTRQNLFSGAYSPGDHHSHGRGGSVMGDVSASPRRVEGGLRHRRLQKLPLRRRDSIRHHLRYKAEVPAQPASASLLAGIRAGTTRYPGLVLLPSTPSCQPPASASPLVDVTLIAAPSFLVRELQASLKSTWRLRSSKHGFVGLAEELPYSNQDNRIAWYQCLIYIFMHKLLSNMLKME